ncbi:MAG TPA: ABC transporter permease, partial [Phycisphaerae bacterium]
MNGFSAILRKEFAHIRREPMTLLFTFVIPVLQLAIFGYAIETTIEHIHTVVLNLDGRSESREFVAALVDSRAFQVVEQAKTDEGFRRAITAGRAKVGVRIPPDYTDRLLRGQNATVQVLIDGSDSQVAMTAMNAANLLGLNQSLRRARVFVETNQTAAARGPTGEFTLPIEVRPRLLYNPDLISARFYVPALVGIILQNVTIFLTAFA